MSCYSLYKMVVVMNIVLDTDPSDMRTDAIRLSIELGCTP